MALYFAYGSNMSVPQMAERCPGAVPVGRARLEGYRFQVAAHGGANIVRVPVVSPVVALETLRDVPREVHGVLWDCTPRHFAILDRYEHVRLGTYYRRYVVTERPDGSPVRALTYLSRMTWPGRVRVNYMLTAVIPGAIAHELPEPYLAELHALLPRVAIGDKRRRYRGRKR